MLVRALPGHAVRWDGYGLGIRTPPADPRPNIRRRPRVGCVVRSAGLMLGRGVHHVDWGCTRVNDLHIRTRNVTRTPGSYHEQSVSSWDELRVWDPGD